MAFHENIGNTKPIKDHTIYIWCSLFQAARVIVSRDRHSVIAMHAGHTKLFDNINSVVTVFP